MSKKGIKTHTCTPNCIYFPQEIKPSEVISEKIDENGVKVRKVKRECLYDGTIINSWAHQCGRKTPCYISQPKEAANDNS